MSRNSFSWFLARRYLRPSRRNRFLSFITAVATIGVMFGTCALLISLSILEGYDQTLRSTIIDFMGHVELTSRFGVDSIADAAGVRQRIRENFPQVDRLSPFVRREAIIRSDLGLEGVLLKGVDPQSDISVVGSRIVDGEFVRWEHEAGARVDIALRNVSRIHLQLPRRPGASRRASRLP